MTAPVQHPMYIDGQFEPGRGDAWIDVINPATEALLSRIPDGSAEDARRAILAAERAQPGWEALPAIERDRRADRRRGRKNTAAGRGGGLLYRRLSGLYGRMGAPL